MGFGDFFSGIFDKIESAGEQGLNRLTDRTLDDFTSQFGHPKDHIPAQNAAGNELANALDRFDQSRPHSRTDYDSLEREILGIADVFSKYVNTYFASSARAQRGALYISNLARQIASDKEKEKNSIPWYSTTGPATPPGATTTYPPPSTGGFGNLPPVPILIGLAAIFLFTRK